MSKDKILKLLLASRGNFVSGEELAGRFNISRTAVWKQIKALERSGYGIESVPSKGHRLMTIPDLLALDDIKRGLKTNVIGRELLILPEASSTNTIAMEMASQGAAEGTVVIAETQTGGKGRLGRTWISPKGNLYLSVVLRPVVPTHKAPLITLMGAVAVASSIRKHPGLKAVIKWPNDIYIAGRKTAGLLTEMSAEPDRVKHLVLGVGINVNMDDKELPAVVRQLSTSLSVEAGEAVDRTRVLQVVLTELDRWYRVFLKNEPAMLEEWKLLNMTIGNRVSVGGPDGTLEGVAQGIDSEGRLILQKDDGSLRRIAAGDVTILKK